jgi:hypothetical protein
LSIDFINSNDWDLIVLNKKVDSVNLLNWYVEIEDRLSYLRCNLYKNKDLLKPAVKGYFTNKEKENFFDLSKADERLLNSYALSWPVQKDIPLPPPWACNLELYPELQEYYNGDDLIKDFDYNNWVYLDQYMFGAWKNLVDEIGIYFRNPRIAQHLNGLILPQHTDGMTVRLHIPITTDNSYFYWGETPYKLMPGNMYLINTRLSHGTTNYGPTRANIISDIDDKDIMDILCLK